jgi:hypothetical protein
VKNKMWKFSHVSKVYVELCRFIENYVGQTRKTFLPPDKKVSMLTKIAFNSFVLMADR